VRMTPAIQRTLQAAAEVQVIFDNQNQHEELKGVEALGA